MKRVTCWWLRKTALNIDSKQGQFKGTRTQDSRLWDCYEKVSSAENHFLLWALKSSVALIVCASDSCPDTIALMLDANSTFQKKCFVSNSFSLFRGTDFDTRQSRCLRIIHWVPSKFRVRPLRHSSGGMGPMCAGIPSQQLPREVFLL